jgi:Tfp pilus assembly protein PilN
MATKRTSRRQLLVEFNPYQILVAEITRPERGVVQLVSSAEFEHDDVAGLRAWIENSDSAQKSGVAVICSLVPLRGVVHRETIEPSRLAEPGYLEDLIQEQQKGRFLTATPFKIVQAGVWTFRTVNAVDGTQLPSSGPAQPALICAMANNEVLEAQERLPGRRVRRERLEPGLLSLFGTIYQHLARRDDTRAVVVILILERVTAVYILGKEGVHTPNPVMHGMNSITEMGKKELGGKNELEVTAQLHKGNPPMIASAAKLLSRISRDLKPVVDSFEMTTGQPVDEIFCAYLPPGLSWITESLARATGRLPFTMDCAEWMPTVGLQVAEGVPEFGTHWLGALGLVANLPETTPRRSRRHSEKHAYIRPWHVDSSVAMDGDDREFAGRRFLAGAGVATMAALAVAVTAWQLYATNSLRSDTIFWERQMSANQKLFTDLSTAGIALRKQSEMLDRAYELMAEPYQLTDLLVNLGRTIPPHVRVERIDTNDGRVAISGSVLEPAEEASGTLGRYMDDLRRNPGVGPLFASMAITTLQRKSNNDEMTFELTLRLNRSTP